MSRLSKRFGGQALVFVIGLPPVFRTFGAMSQGRKNLAAGTSILAWTNRCPSFAALPGTGPWRMVFSKA
jgi:hypothetical protein